jgi:hypothetical protein
VDPLRHLIGVERFVEPSGQRLAGQSDVHGDRLGAFEQAIEMKVEEGDPPLVDAQTLPHAVAEDEARIEHRHHRLAARLQIAVDADQDRFVARIGRAVVRSLGHRARVEARPGLGKAAVI